MLATVFNSMIPRKNPKDFNKLAYSAEDFLFVRFTWTAFKDHMGYFNGIRDQRDHIIRILEHRDRMDHRDNRDNREPIRYYIDRMREPITASGPQQKTFGPH